MPFNIFQVLVNLVLTGVRSFVALTLKCAKAFLRVFHPLEDFFVHVMHDCNLVWIASNLKFCKVCKKELVYF
jgi:hypothetical protein